jgi:penicillin amidase
MEKSKSGFAANLFSALLSPLIKHLARPSLPKYQGHTSIPGLEHRVEVHWQEHGIPHVRAGNEHDLFMAQGYLHAQERLWQMDSSRRFLTGQMAEVFGRFNVPWRELSSHFRSADSVDFDYFMRLMGIRPAALASLDLLSDHDRTTLQSYSDGVNRYIEEFSKKLPWEFRLLRYAPEPWRPEDCLTIGKGFAFLLSAGLFSRLNMIALAAKLLNQPDKLRSLYPAYPDDGPTITTAVWDSVREIWHFMNGTFTASDWHPAGHGSNSWVVAPSRSATGNAILCNDPHLRMTLPSIWYLIHLTAAANSAEPDGYDSWGASIPGSPCIQVGHNRWIAWGVTAGLCDDVELYQEKIHRLEPNLYLSGHQWRAIEQRHEIIRIRWRGSIKKVVRSTCHGPIISDFGKQDATGEVLALRWTAHDAGPDFRCLDGLNRARNWDEFLNSLAHHGAPSLNYTYADREGNIGYSLAGKIPVRARVPSLLPLQGWDRSNEWKGYVPFKEMPRIYNPADGVIITANNKIVDAAYPYYLSHFFEPPYRGRRIKQLLSGDNNCSVEDMARIQQDLVSLHGKELLETLRIDLQPLAAHGGLLGEATQQLLEWDGRCDTESVAAAIFHVFHSKLAASLLVPTLGMDLFLSFMEQFNQSLTPLETILKNPVSPWFAGTARTALVTKSLRDAVEELNESLGNNLADWHWGQIHTLTLNHALGRISLLKPILSIGPRHSQGDCTTVNIGFYRHSDPYRHTVGVSLRIITELSDPPRSTAILASGQSGHPFSRHYRDQTELWRMGGFIRLCPGEKMLKEMSVLTLTPSGTEQGTLSAC